MKLGFEDCCSQKVKNNSCCRSLDNPMPVFNNLNNEKTKNTIPEKHIPTEEEINAEYSAIESLIRVALICEDVAKKARNMGDTATEDRYLVEATHALETANMLYILTHK